MVIWIQYRVYCICGKKLYAQHAVSVVSGMECQVFFLEGGGGRYSVSRPILEIF